MLFGLHLCYKYVFFNNKPIVFVQFLFLVRILISLVGKGQISVHYLHNLYQLVEDPQKQESVEYKRNIFWIYNNYIARSLIFVHGYGIFI